MGNWFFLAGYYPFSELVVYLLENLLTAFSLLAKISIYYD